MHTTSKVTDQLALEQLMDPRITPSRFEPPTVHLHPAAQSSPRPRVPEIIALYGALIFLLWFARCFIVAPPRQLQRGGQRGGNPRPLRHEHQIPTIKINEDEVKDI
ncbi:hypothetical protein BDV10DRAFT_177731 [Aspergillus recurvatus]